MQVGMNVSLIRAHLRTCPSACAGFYYSNLVWQRDHTKVERKIGSTLAENGPAMAGPVGPVLAPMCIVADKWWNAVRNKEVLPRH